MKTNNEISRREFLKKVGLGGAVLALSSIIFPRKTMAMVTDNLSSNEIYVGVSQPSTSSAYLMWMNTSEGLMYYRKTLSDSVWMPVSSVWS